MKLIIEPHDGVAPIVSAIKKAKRSVEITIFRIDPCLRSSALTFRTDASVPTLRFLTQLSRSSEVAPLVASEIRRKE